MENMTLYLFTGINLKTNEKLKSFHLGVGDKLLLTQGDISYHNEVQVWNEIIQFLS